MGVCGCSGGCEVVWVCVCGCSGGCEVDGLDRNDRATNIGQLRDVSSISAVALNCLPGNDAIKEIEGKRKPTRFYVDVAESRKVISISCMFCCCSFQ